MFLDNVVIGSDISAALYSVVNDKYFLSTTSRPPLFCEHSPISLFGSTRSDIIWSRTILILALQGKLVSHEEIENIKISDEEIKIATPSGAWKYSFNLCEIFDPTGTRIENSIVQPIEPSYTVYDDFELSRLGSKHQYLQPYSKPSETLVKRVDFYTSSRVDGANYVTDCLTKSKLTENQLNDFEYSDTMARFCVERILESMGVYGNFMNFYKSGSPKYRKPKVVHKKRVIIKKDNNIYLDSEKIKFLEINIPEIFNDISTA